MTTQSARMIDRQALLACIPEDWKIKFKEGLGRSPILKLVAIQVSQQVIETYRHRLELALRTGETVPPKRKSPYLQISQDAGGQAKVSLSRAGESLQKPLAATEERVAQFFQATPFWEAAATYMWHDLIQIAYAAMTGAIAPATLLALDQATQLETLYRYIFDETSDSLTSNFSDILAVYIDQAVQLVLEKDNLATKSLKELEGLAGLGQKAAPSAPFTHPDLFINRTTHNFATCKLLWESVNVLTQRTDLLWQPDAEGKLAYTRTLNDGRGKLIFWVTDDLEAQSPESLAGEAALTVIETFDIRAACMHLIYAAHVTTLDRPWEEEFVIDDTQIAAYLGLDKRKDLTKEKRLKLIERIAEQPAQILTFLHWPQQGQIESFYVEKSRLWEVAIGYHGQRDIFGGIKCTGLTIRCRAGMWAKYFLNKRGADEGAAFYQYGVLSKTLLQTINRVWQHSEGAARMLSWLSF